MVFFRQGVVARVAINPRTAEKGSRLRPGKTEAIDGLRPRFVKEGDCFDGCLLPMASAK